MRLSANEITIAVTVYRRLEYLREALASAVNQTVPVRVRLYDDGVQDREKLARIMDEFGDRVVYCRNERTLGLFGNMNQAIADSPTPWVSVLHDDDALMPTFIEQILAVAAKVKEAKLFCGGTVFIDAHRESFYRLGLPRGEEYRVLNAEDFAVRNWFTFPGQLIHAQTAHAVGGFPRASIYTGDWELWFKLATAGGVVQIGADVCYYRSHHGADRGTNAATARGRATACRAMQCRRNLARLRYGSKSHRFDRAEFLRHHAPTYRELLLYGCYMPAWLLRYNRKLLLQTRAMTKAAKFLHAISLCFGNPGLRVTSAAHVAYTRLTGRQPRIF